jgi:uncharacterized membrane protein HdeD (DUF308 family)
MLLQGVVLVLLSISFFVLPEKPLGSFQTIVSLVALLQSVIFILGYFFTDPFDKSQAEMILGIILFVVSLFFLFERSQNNYMGSLFLSVYMLFNGCFYAAISWILRYEMTYGWLIMILPVFTLIIVFLLLTSLPQTTTLIHFLIGLQFLWCGIAVLKMAMVTRRIEAEFKKPINRFYVE